MLAYNNYNCLIIDRSYEENWIRLINKYDLQTVVYNDEAYSYALCYRLDEHGYMVKADDILTEKDFVGLYYSACEVDSPEGVMLFDTYNDDEPQPFVKADWNNHDHYYMLESEHGIITKYFFDEYTDIIDGTCYEAKNCVSQVYPSVNAQRFFKFVSGKGDEYYVKETKPFFIDDFDYVHEFSTKEEFDRYDA